MKTTAAAPDRTGKLIGPGLCAAARTDRGPVRAQNEDTFVCAPERGLFAVIDGMGGQQAGKTAAAMTRDALLDEPDLVRALCMANDRVHGLAQDNPAMKGMGCVGSALQISGAAVRIAHVGDTRIYVAGQAGCEQLTRDHTVAAEFQEEMGLSESGARELSGHNKVTRDIGGHLHGADDAWIDRLEIGLDDGDLLLLCSDGLHGVVPRDELFGWLKRARREGTSCETLANSLVDLALERGSRDNVTAVVVQRVTEASATEARAAESARPRHDHELRTMLENMRMRRPGVRARFWLLLGFTLGFAARSLVPVEKLPGLKQRWESLLSTVTAVSSPEPEVARGADAARRDR